MISNDKYQLNEIVEKELLAPSIVRFRVFTPVIADAVKAGQFVVVRTDDYAERVPLTVADCDPEEKIITLIVQIVGTATQKMDAFEVGDVFLDVVGPLGKPTEIEKVGTVICIGGGVGVAPVYPITKALREAGNKILSIIGARTKDMLILEEEMRAISDEFFVTTDDGTEGHHGFVTDELKRLIDEGEAIDLVVAVGPAIMMRVVAETTRPHKIKTIVSLNSLMVDGTGMCGGCRIKIGGTTKFVCVDGPEFNGHLVDFEELIQRSRMYAREEHRAMWDHACRIQEAEEMLKRANKREPMPKQDPKLRIKNFNEVALGYTKDQALREASRCLQCKKAFCVEGCPVDIDIPAFIALIKERDFIGAIHKIKEKNSLPAVCGRVCPQEAQCEAACILSKKKEPVAIGRLERFVADYEFDQGEVRIPKRQPQTGKMVAVIGAGPAGLTAAGELCKMGHRVTIFEALHSPGGVLVYGIPEFRLPKWIVQRESDYIGKLGAEIKVSYVVGKARTIDGLLEDGYDAVFIGTGAGLPYFLNIPGENFNGVYSANEFLTRVNLMKAYLFPEYNTPIRLGRNIAVIGGGNVAMDSARTALRLGAENVYLIYRRSREEMPAREEEIENAFEEGVQPFLLTNPIRIHGTDNGWVKKIECLKMKLGEADDSGRRRPVPIEGSEHTLDVDMVVVAIGQGPNPLLTATTPDLELTGRGNIIADEETGKTSKKGVFAGGDIVTGAATVILAMGAGKSAAKSINKYLTDGKW
jgi:glutamate synthase (NADPH/NADH) small chain